MEASIIDMIVNRFGRNDAHGMPTQFHTYMRTSSVGISGTLTGISLMLVVVLVWTLYMTPSNSSNVQMLMSTVAGSHPVRNTNK